MARYIDAEQAKTFFEEMDAGSRAHATLLTPHEFAEYLDEIPTANVVEVIRCKDCKWFNEIGCAISIVNESDRPTENDRRKKE